MFKDKIVEQLNLPYVEDKDCFWTVKSELHDVYQFWWVITLHQKTHKGFWSKIIKSESIRVEHPNQLPEKELRSAAVRIVQTVL